MLGASIYYSETNKSEIINYIDLLAKYNIKRLFTCLLSVENADEKFIQDIKEVISCANKNNIEVFMDISPALLEKMQLPKNDLKFFAELGLAGVRLDAGHNGEYEAIMTYNEYDLKIEINASNDVSYLNTIVDYKPYFKNLYGCHNFYPQYYSGLNYEHFISCSKRFKAQNINLACFVSSPTAKVGPWKIMDGLCTLEMHRDMSIENQVKHLYALGMIDDVIIGNAYASEEELIAINQIKPGFVNLTIELQDDITHLEETIITKEFHYNRGDINDYLIRSTQSRVKYKAEDFPARQKDDVLKTGDIIIGTDNFGHYKGELQIIKKPIKDIDTRNLVAKIVEEDLFLLDYVEPWTKINFLVKK